MATDLESSRMRPTFQWHLGSRSLELGKRTLIMGVVNVTPDSFSDGGHFLEVGKAVEHASRLLDEGADIIDIGGESTRPGARVDTAVSASSEQARTMPAVSAEEELKRVIPVILALKRTHPAAVISVDTYKAATARAAVGAGAEIVNDVSGFRWDPQMLSTVRDLQCGAVLMHMRGRPEQWHSLPPLTDVVGLVKQELTELVENVIAQGVGRERIVLDPGFGFGKSFDQNYPLIAHLDALQEIGFPLLAGASRKSFIGRTLGGEKSISPAERLFGTIAAETALILNGAHILRTHSVRASAEAARVADATLKAT